MKLRTKKEYFEETAVARAYARKAAEQVPKREPLARQYRDREDRIWTKSTDGLYYHQQYILTSAEISTMNLVGSIKPLEDYNEDDF